MASGNLTLTLKNMTQCVEFPPHIHSAGIFSYKTSAGIPYTLPNLEMQMVLIFFMTQAFYFVLRYFGVPRFSTQVITGIILGPTLLGHFKFFGEYLFNVNSQEILGVLAEFGYGFFMFVIGVKMDLGMINRTGQKALCLGVACVVAPLVVGMLVQTKLTSSFFNLTEQEMFRLPFVNVINCMTPFPVVALLLEELKILNSEIGRLGMSAALVSDIFSGFLQFVGKMVKMIKENSREDTITMVGASIGYIIVVVALLRPAMYWVIKQTPENRPVKKTYVNIIIMLMLTSGVLSHMYGQGFHFGPFIFGLAVPAGPPLGSAIEEKLNLFVSDVLLPIFVTACSMRTDFWSLKYLSTDAYTQVNGILFVVVLVTKFFASIVPPLYCRMPFSDALAIALILSCKGIVNLSAYTDYRDNLTISDPSFALAITSVLVTATFVPIAVKYLYDPSRKYAGYQRRNIMHLKPNAELKILSCIHRSANMPAVINLLDAACPSKENPIAVYVLHLIELVGRASPVFISHQMQRKSSSNISYSDNVILYFNHFVRENLGAVSLSTFTSISAPKYMHEDICTVALDKLVSLIVLPFHRRWSVDGSVESEDNNTRILNCSVLDRAPCSVGILVDRGHLGQSSIVAPGSSFSVAIIFLGGKDDREALAFVKRMTNDSTISLTVIRLVASADEVDGSKWDNVLDAEELKGFRYNDVREGFVIYLEEVVEDGPQTALFLRSIVDDYDLIIVGRRFNVNSPQTSGLSEWSEFPELGTIGDLLASPDITCRASILVVQQQKMVTQ
ncbi:hypothetical protein GBA52_021486 [Prunus armeniaca]|nr:hypothetical protein GBA52_021486 [Prunus armeniaca]